MFAITCPVHGSRVLLWPSAITGIDNTADGIHVHFRCTCGFEGVWTTGRDVRETLRTSAVPVRRTGVLADAA